MPAMPLPIPAAPLPPPLPMPSPVFTHLAVPAALTTPQLAPAQPRPSAIPAPILSQPCAQPAALPSPVIPSSLPPGLLLLPFPASSLPMWPMLPFAVPVNPLPMLQFAASTMPVLTGLLLPADNLLPGPFTPPRLIPTQLLTMPISPLARRLLPPAAAPSLLPIADNTPLFALSTPRLLLPMLDGLNPLPFATSLPPAVLPPPLSLPSPGEPLHVPAAKPLALPAVPDDLLLMLPPPLPGPFVLPPPAVSPSPLPLPMPGEPLHVPAAEPLPIATSMPPATPVIWPLPSPLPVHNPTIAVTSKQLPPVDKIPLLVVPPGASGAVTRLLQLPQAISVSADAFATKAEIPTMAAVKAISVMNDAEAAATADIPATNAAIAAAPAYSIATIAIAGTRTRPRHRTWRTPTVLKVF